MENLGHKIAELRKKIGMSAAELARRAGVTRGFISLVERGRSGIGEEKLLILASILGVDWQTLRHCSTTDVSDRPAWLRFLVEKFLLSSPDERELKKLASKISLVEYLPGEPIRESKGRWESFYEQMLPYLPSAPTKVLLDSDVRMALKFLGISRNNATWRDVFTAFSGLVGRRFQNADVETGAQWKMLVAQILHIRDLDLLNVEGGKSLEMDIAAVLSQIKSSLRIYGSVVRNDDGDYMFISQPKAYFNRRDFAWWHEATRILIDPSLNLGRGAYYFPDGEDIPPFACFLRRLAAWFAYMPFKSVWLSESEKEKAMPIKLQNFVSRIYGDVMPWRESFIALLDFNDSPLVYLDCYPRMKWGELRDCGISPENLKEMCSNEKASLRIGYVFRNLAAEEMGFELRNSLRVADSSPIAEAFRGSVESLSNGTEDLSNWDKAYDLIGTVREHCLNQIGVNGERHVRVIMEINKW